MLRTTGENIVIALIVSTVLMAAGIGFIYFVSWLAGTASGNEAAPFIIAAFIWLLITIGVYVRVSSE